MDVMIGKPEGFHVVIDDGVERRLAHVVDYSAYQKAVEALKAIARGDRRDDIFLFDTPFDWRLQSQAKMALRELGEIE